MLRETIRRGEGGGGNDWRRREKASLLVSELDAQKT